MANKLIQLIPQKQMQFDPVPVDNDDDLSKAINDDPVVHDDQWDLSDAIDGEKLEAFWDDALREIGPEAPEDER